MALQLSEHFSLEELTNSDTAIRHGIDNTASDSVCSNLSRLCVLLEQVRALLGKPIHINSGFRCPELNTLVKGQPNSQHLLGCAADIKIDGMTPDEVVKAIIDSDIHYDQIIREFDSWTHISVPNTANDFYRHSKLIIDKNGTRSY
jgi:zinc D-Ala-D-Ala carboxypeptidase